MIRALAIALTCFSATAQEFIPYFSAETGNYLLNNNVAFWRFEETTGNASDASINGRTLTVNETPGTVGGVVGNARTYSNTGADYFYRASESAFNFSGGAFTITAWADFDPASLATSDMTIIGRGSQAGTDFTWWLMKDYGTPNDSINFVYSTDGSFDYGNRVTFNFDGQVEGGSYFVAVRWDGATLHLSATHGGESSLEADQTVSFAGPFYSGAAQLRVGEAEGSDLHDMGGTIDELGVWSRYLTDCELQWLFTARSGSFTYTTFNSLPCANP